MADNVIQLPEKPEKVTPVKDSKASKRKSRQALHSYLANDEEYANMPDFIVVDEALESSIDADVKAETQVVNAKNVMKLVYLDVQGYGAQVIATQMKLSIDEVQQIRRSVAYKRAKDAVMAEVSNTARQMIEVTAIKAVKTLTECLESRNDKVKLSAAVEILNRTGLTATQKIELTTTTGGLENYTEEQLAEIMRSSMAIPAEAEVVPDGAE